VSVSGGFSWGVGFAWVGKMVFGASKMWLAAKAKFRNIFILFYYSACQFWLRFNQFAGGVESYFFLGERKS